jgi:ABC-type nitrate/sulfonate/bicarbonate transport system substrate-binding protein
MKMSGSQGIGAFVRREWAQQYADLLARYIAAFVESERRLMSPANQQEAIDIVAKDAKLPADIPNLRKQHQGRLAKKNAEFDVAG